MLRRSGPASLRIWFDGRAVAARGGDSVAVALLAAGITATRRTPLSGAPRGPFCLMGTCFECLAVVDGRPNTQTCKTLVHDGMQVAFQDGAPERQGTVPPATLDV